MKTQWSKLKGLIANSGYTGHSYLVLLQEDGKVISANARMAKKFPIAELVKGNAEFFSILHPSSWRHFSDGLQQAKISQLPVNKNLVVSNGTNVTIRWVITHLQGSSGQFLLTGIEKIDERYNYKSSSPFIQSLADYSALPEAVILHNENAELVAVQVNSSNGDDTELKELLQKFTASAHLLEQKLEIRDEKGMPVEMSSLPFTKAIADKTAKSMLLALRVKGNLYKWFHFYSIYIEDVKQRCVTLVTETDAAGRPLQLSSPFKMLREKAVFRNPNPLLITDDEAMIIYANDAYFQFFNTGSDTCLGRSINETIPSSLATLFKKEAAVLSTYGVPIRNLYKVLLNDKEYSLLMDLFYINRGEGQKMTVCQFTDLTDHLVPDKRLKEAYDRLLLLGRTTTDAIWEWDMISGETYRNDVLMDLIGYAPEKQTGISWWLKRIHPEDRQRVSETIKNCTDNGLMSWQDEYSFKCANGEYKFVRDRGFIIYETGLPVKMIGSLQDVTDIKKLEKELLNERMRKQYEISETVIKAQENERTLIGNELHDNVNQLLSTARLFVGMLNPETEPEKQVKQKSMEYILTAIEEIRKISKELVNPSLKSDGLIQAVKDLVTDFEFTTGIKVRFVHDNEADMLSSGKKLALFRIIQEQIKNITKYSKAENVDLFLQRKNNLFCMVVKDDGIGFETGNEVKGIGLFNISERVKFYNGSSAITSSPGNGCTLEVSIPFGEVIVEMLHHKAG